MAWRLHLTNRAVQQLDILKGSPDILAAWWRRDRVTYYDLNTGVLIAEEMLSVPEVDDRNSLAWQEFVRTLKAPNGATLPLVYTPHEAVYLAQNPDLRLYRAGGSDLFLQLEHGTDEIKLDVRSTTSFRQVVFDRSGEIVTGIDPKGKIHLYRKTKRLGTYDGGLKIKEDISANIAISTGGTHLYGSDNRQIVLMDMNGKVTRRIETHYLIGRMTCSPDGTQLATSDLETGVIRVYDAQLKLTHQRFAIDLLAEAKQLQLLADLPPVFTALNALTMGDDGVVAFSMSGIICVTSLNHFNPLTASVLKTERIARVITHLEAQRETPENGDPSPV
jgi:WD40 repeat protein